VQVYSNQTDHVRDERNRMNVWCLVSCGVLCGLEFLRAISELGNDWADPENSSLVLDHADENEVDDFADAKEAHSEA
jgi:hypothetical protein